MLTHASESGCSGQLRFSCPVKYENITIKEDGLVDWAVSRTQGKQTGLSWIHTLDRQIEGQSSEGQIMDAAAKDGDTVTSKIPFVDFILCRCSGAGRGMRTKADIDFANRL